jgi:integrase/recombinase XerD
MRKVQETKLSEVFSLYLASAAAKGVKDKTLKTYEQHFNAISKRLDVDSNISLITSKHLDKMILRMREDGLSDSSINSYTRTLKVFFSWCNEQGYTKTNLKIYKASETVKETYTDDELMTLLKKPDADCKFCEYRNWVIVNFLLNSGCRAATVRNIQNQDVDLSRKQIVLRHTKNGKVQVIPLCTAMVSILRDYMAVREGESSDYLFCNEFGGFLTENALRLLLFTERQQLLVNFFDLPLQTLHCFQKSFASNFQFVLFGQRPTLSSVVTVVAVFFLTVLTFNR